ncbi:hypothetical protein KGQ20_09935 [Catenulispora sp. NF23]|uniref:Glycosyl transferase family 9 n=1 Tax=Catenulispora pinistramenti TaxID=2705254 RepID=A0ABS5KRA2_9ACTN|nr:hypothetical protein [Catenulispora pinistramenti]MBS2533096.1 hypothetical protein [Catenulispora pinistramenti]MBS2548577.1 hypothetical protein [Catenulispora pinistramenti]
MEFVNDPHSDATSFKLGDLLLQMAAARAVSDAVTAIGRNVSPLLYSGPRHKLMERSELSFAECEPAAVSRVVSPGPSPVRIKVGPTRTPVWDDDRDEGGPGSASLVPPWLDLLGDDVEVHSTLPMRYYLDIEQRLGVRLTEGTAPAPRYHSSVTEAEPRRAVLVATTSAYGSRQDYGAQGLIRVAQALADLDHRSDWRFTLVTNKKEHEAAARSAPFPVDLVLDAEAADCVDIFAAGELVIGHDTGLTHLAALAVRPDGTGPQVIALHGRFSHLKWLTGSARHHSVATPAAQMMALTDVGLYINAYGRAIDDEVWGVSAVSDIPPGVIAGFAADLLGPQPLTKRD